MESTEQWWTYLSELNEGADSDELNGRGSCTFSLSSTTKGRTARPGENEATMSVSYHAFLVCVSVFLI